MGFFFPVGECMCRWLQMNISPVAQFFLSALKILAKTMYCTNTCLSIVASWPTSNTLETWTLRASMLPPLVLPLLEQFVLLTRIYLQRSLTFFPNLNLQSTEVIACHCFSWIFWETFLKHAYLLASNSNVWCVKKLVWDLVNDFFFCDSFIHTRFFIIWICLCHGHITGLWHMSP